MSSSTILSSLPNQTPHGNSNNTCERKEETCIQDGAVTLKQLLSNPDLLKEPEAIIPLFAFQGRVTMIAAREKSGKSTIASCLAAHVSSEQAFLGRITNCRCVLYLALEEHLSEVVRRMVNFGADPKNVFIIDRVDEPLEELERWINNLKPVLVVIDTLASFVADKRPESSSSAAWTPIMQRLCRIARDSNTAILLLHHAQKSRHGEYRDSTAIGAGVDLIILMKWISERKRRFKCRGRWSTSDFTLILQRDGKTYSIEGSDVPLEERIIEFVRENSECTCRELRNGVIGSSSRITEIRKLLLDKGIIEEYQDENALRIRISEPA